MKPIVMRRSICLKTVETVVECSYEAYCYAHAVVAWAVNLFGFKESFKEFDNIYKIIYVFVNLSKI